ncbi:IPExxxVDY family protein [Sphingobacterium sp. E70]|uniref:IPExxxVDY family protein n=1 Tax=Sphingobacterium sp. E70 TaxID=2853439 RepID=UPI00211C7045|nr:IPExxxVDY family protein [Sphingobacterium sp. E70]
MVNKLVARLDMDMDEELDFTLLAITCPLKDYRLCHFINKMTNLDFSRGKESKYDHDGRPKNKSEEELEYHIIFDVKKKSAITSLLFIISVRIPTQNIFLLTIKVLREPF